VLESLPAGAVVSSLRDEIDSKPEGIEAHLGRYLNVQRDAF